MVTREIHSTLKDLKRGGVEAALVFFENWQTSDKRLGSNRTETRVEARTGGLKVWP